MASTRDRIIRGARRVVRARGLHGLTAERVLRAADVSRRTFYLQFDSPEHVLAALYEQELAELVSSVEEAMARHADDPMAQVRSGLDAWLDFQWRGGRVLSLLEAEAVRPDSRLAPARERVLDGLVRVIGGAVEKAAGRSIDPWVWRAVLIGLEGLVLGVTAQRELTAPAKKRLRAVALPFLLSVVLSAQHLAPAPPRSGGRRS